MGGSVESSRCAVIPAREGVIRPMGGWISGPWSGSRFDRCAVGLLLVEVIRTENARLPWSGSLSARLASPELGWMQVPSWADGENLPIYLDSGKRFFPKFLPERYG